MITNIISSLAQTSNGTAGDFFGDIETPPGIDKYGGEDAAGLITLFNNFLRLAIVIAGLFTLVNFLTAAIWYIGSSGNPDTIKQATSRIWMSLLGLLIVGASIALAAVIGLIFFGSATAILSPTIPTITGP